MSCCVLAYLPMFRLTVAMLLLVAALLRPVVCSPGSPWTEEEALIVKAKLYAIIGEYGNRVRQTQD